MIEQASLVLGNGNWAVKSDSLLGYKTIDGKYYPREFTFTRATTGTRVNEAGLVELVPYNLLSWSEEFENAYWALSRTSSFGSGSIVNDTTAPDGTLTAEYIQQASGQITGGGILVIQTYVVGQTYTLSVYAKKKENSILRPGFSIGPTASGIFGQFDLENGVTLTPSAGITQAIENVGNGWYRCSITATAQVSGSYNTFIYQSSTINSFDTTPLTGIYIWGAQLVEGTEPLDYLPTTDRLDIARIDYSTGEPVLLVEPQRTNLLLQSSSFDSGAWGKTAVSVTANSTTSPSGIVDADTLTGDGTFAQHQIRQFGTVTSGLTYTTSIYAKKNTNNFIQIYNTNTFFGSNVWANFDLNLGVVGSVGTETTASIQNVGNGWYRCTITGTATASGSVSISFFNLITSATSARGESNTLSTSVFLWGAQFEAGAYATSYIPTTTASVTRNDDKVYKTGISSLIGQTEGTLFFECSSKAFPISQYLVISDGTGNNRINIYQVDDNNLGVLVRTSSTTVVNITNVLLPSTGTIKFALGYANNDFVLYLNGNQVGTDTSGAIPLTNSLILGGNADFTTSAGNQKFNATALWKTRLTNAELATLTTI